MATAPSTEQPLVKSLAGAWDRFFFRAADPTPLGVMRIVTGVLVLYIHLAYTLDLREFFGKNAWLDQQVTHELRTDVPIVGWPVGWNSLQPSVYLPEGFAARKTILDWMRGLPDNRAERQNRLRYLYEMPQDSVGQFQALTFVRRLSSNFDKREARLRDMVNLPADRAERDRKIPPFVQAMAPDQRARVADDVRELWAALPPDDVRLTPDQQPRDRILKWLIDLTADQRGVSLKFINTLPDDPAKRKELLDYLQTWRIDYRQLLTRGQPIWSVFFHVTEPPGLYWAHGTILAVIVLFTIGFCTRITSVLTFLGTLSYINRDTAVLFGMDTMQTVLLFYLMIGPSGGALSVDRLIARYRALRARRPGAADFRLSGPEPSVLANFTLRLVQIHFCFIYMASGLSKLKGNAWWEQTAIWYTMVNPEFCPTNWGVYNIVMRFLASHRFLFHTGMSMGVVFTLFMEIGLPFLIWSRRWRPVMLVGAFMLHTGIAGIMGLTGFGLFMLALLLAFVPASTFRRWLALEPGEWPTLTLRIHATEPRQARAAVLVRTADVWDQVRVVDDPSVGRPTLVRPDGTAVPESELLPAVTRSLRLLTPLRWLLWVPGVSALGRSRLADFDQPTAAPARRDRPHSVAS